MRIKSVGYVYKRSGYTVKLLQVSFVYCILRHQTLYKWQLPLQGVTMGKFRSKCLFQHKPLRKVFVGKTVVESTEISLHIVHKGYQFSLYGRKHIDICCNECQTQEKC